MPLSRIGPFALEEPLDGLTDSNVLRGVHVERPLTMAIKLLPRQVARHAMGASTFASDIKELQKLVHPGIARIYGGAMEQGQPYLVLEMINGESLRSQLDRRDKLPWEVAVDIADAICIALAYAHETGFVHQRLTPSRVLLPQDGEVKLIGFDCVWSDKDEVLGLRSPMSIANYLAPEEFRGKQSASQPQCDLFSLGVILYECLTGELPWHAETPSELVQARRDQPAPRVSTKVLDCPVWLDALVAKLLEIKRTDRLPSAIETHRAIVTAKSKAEAGMGAAQHAWSGKTGVLDVAQDRSELKKIRQRASRTKPKSEPFYERAWFLALCLLAVLGFGTWAMWPLNEDQLFAKAKPLMESDSSVDWMLAKEGYLGSLLERFPETKYAEEIQEFEHKYAMHQAEKKITSPKPHQNKSKTEAHRAYEEAWDFEQFGDRYTAWQKYEALIHLFEDSQDSEDRAFVSLARRQIQQIKSSDEQDENLSALLEAKIQEAREVAKSGNKLRARRKLDGIVTLYAKNQEVRPQVEEAREVIRRLDSGAE